MTEPVRRMQRAQSHFAIALAALAPATALAQKSAKDESDAFFDKGVIHELRLALPGESEAALRESPREYAPFELWVDGKRLGAGGVKLKGAAGSFREYDDLPAFTVRLDKFGGAERLHGLVKFHLNNSVQDQARLCEWIGSEVFRSAGDPAPRVGHALVKLNDRKLGLYVLKEGVDERFVARWFGAAKGNLYDGGFCQDVDAELERDVSGGPRDRSDLAALADACGEPDMTVRWAKLEPLIELAPFVRFMALEELLGHWDGYTINANNYRLFIARGGKARFLPHGMDQLFGEPEASVLDMPSPLLSSSVMKRPQWRTLYRRELKEQLGRIEPKALSRKLEPVQARIQSAYSRWDKDAAREQEERYRELLQRIAERHAFLAAEVTAPEPKPLVLKPGVAVGIKNWRPHSEVDDARVERKTENGQEWLIVECGASARCVAGYRRGLLLDRGRYRLAADAHFRNVVALEEEDAPKGGVALRISGARTEQVHSGSGRRDLTFEFEIEHETADVELVLELRAKSGSLRVPADSLKLTRLR